MNMLLAAAASCEASLGEDNDVNQDNEEDMLLLPTVTDSVIDDVDNDDDDDGALVSQLPSSAYNPSPSCGNPAATDQSTVGLLTDDPALWPKKLTAEERCAIVRKGPIQISVLEFPKNQEGRRFTSNNYCFQMKNGEKINRTWLIYSESGDCVMCFCCRLFGEGNTHLSSDGFNNWKNLGAHLKQHERSAEHVSHMESWHTLTQRLQTGTAMDQLNQNAMMAEIERLRNIFKRLLAIINHLAERNLVFRGHTEK